MYIFPWENLHDNGREERRAKISFRKDEEEEEDDEKDEEEEGDEDEEEGKEK